MRRLGHIANIALVALIGLCLVRPLSAQETVGYHEVDTGDTLWDLAANYLADPFRWSEIFELNLEVVEDPHWIFPGEILRLPGYTGAVPPGVTAGGADPNTPIYGYKRGGDPGVRQWSRGVPQEGRQVAGAIPDGSLFEENRGLSVNLGSFEALERQAVEGVTRDDFYRMGILVQPDNVPPHGNAARIIEANPLGLDIPPSIRPHDVVVLDLGTISVQPGDSVQAVRLGNPMRAVDGTPFGRILHSMAILTISEVDGDSARAEVIQLYGAFQVGDFIMPIQPFDGVGIGAEPVEDGVTGRLIGLEHEQPLIGPDDPLFLDVGLDDGVQVGDEFAVFAKTERSAEAARYDDRLLTLRAIRVVPSTTSAIVVEVRDVGASPGDFVRLVGRLP